MTLSRQSPILRKTDLDSQPLLRVLREPKGLKAGGRELTLGEVNRYVHSRTINNHILPVTDDKGTKVSLALFLQIQGHGSLRPRRALTRT